MARTFKTLSLSLPPGAFEELAYERLLVFNADPIGKLLWSRMVVIDGEVVVKTASEILAMCAGSDSLTMVIPRFPSGKRMRIYGWPRVFGIVLDDERPDGTSVEVATADIKQCFIANLDTIERVAVRLAEANVDSETSAKWMDEYRMCIAAVRPEVLP